MYQVDSSYPQEFELVQSESNVVALPLTQEISDSVCDRTTFFENVSVTSEANVEREITQLASERKFEQFISNLLQYGVLLSSAIVLLGGILYLIRHGSEPADYRFFLGEPAIFCSPSGVVTAVLSGNHRGIIQLGLLILIATPIARVAFSLLAFLWQRNFTYVILTALVLAGLIYSFVGAYA